MRAPSLLVFTLCFAVACGSVDTPTLGIPEHPVASTQTAPPTTTVAAPAAPKEPFTLPASQGPSAYVDRLTFWGWSEDGARYAFSTFYPGPGAAMCEGSAELFVVDADADAYVKGAHRAWAYPEPESASGVCTGDPPERQMEAEVGPLLEQHGIVVGLGTEHRPVEKPAGTDQRVVILPSGTQVEVRFAEGGDGWEDGAWFDLALTARGETIEVESGQRKRENVLGYKPRFVFFGPTGRVAVVTQVSRIDFEGQNLAWMTNGLKLPAGW